MKAMRYPTARIVAVDVDGTLVRRDGELNQAVLAWCRQRRSDGFELYLWSARGKAHAAAVAEAFGIMDVFDLILSKPGYVVDDMGLSWSKYIKTINPHQLIDE